MRTALRTVAPWSASPAGTGPRYPGRFAIWREIFGNRVGYEGIRNWDKGHRPAPQWARDTLAAHLEREAFTRLEIAKELRKPAATSKNEKSPP